MSEINTSPLSGFLELLPKEQRLFNHMRATIAHVYERFGFVPLDLPLVERAEILLAKAGGESEQQMYRFQKGEHDLGLRFDLTVPLARYVTHHYNDLSFPFKVYQIGKVYRGERAQRGRYREFYQCDADIIGEESLSPLNDAELLCVLYTAFKELGLPPFCIRINNRKILEGLCEALGIATHYLETLRIIDKVDKIGPTQVEKLLLDEVKLSPTIVKKLLALINITGKPTDVLKALEKLSIHNTVFERGLTELTQIAQALKAFGIPTDYYEISPAIVRGLDYYTGTVYECFVKDHRDLGSICSGGRYENLTSTFGKRTLPGVGVSIGLTRLFLPLLETGLIENKQTPTPAKVLIIPMGEAEMTPAMTLAAHLRESEIPTQLYLEAVKIKKVMAYADDIKVPYVIILGSDEVREGKVTLKDMQTGQQESLPLSAIIKKLS